MHQQMRRQNTVSEFGGMISVDTTFVLFFLALEYGRAVRFFSLDGALMGTTMLMVLVLPYFLPARYAKPTFSNWLAGRTAIALFGMILGSILSITAGTMLPASVKYVPMAGLVITSLLSCYIQFYSLIRLRPAK